MNFLTASPPPSTFKHVNHLEIVSVKTLAFIGSCSLMTMKITEFFSLAVTMAYFCYSSLSTPRIDYHFICTEKSFLASFPLIQTDARFDFVRSPLSR